MAFRNKRCLVTGGAGFIGSNLVLRLVTEGAEVTVLDSFVQDLGGNLFNLEPCASKIRMIRGDQADSSVILPLVEGQDFIFNLAGNVSHQDSMRQPLSDLAMNVTAHVQLLEACRQIKSQAVVVYASTRQIYGAPQYVPVDEKHPISPVDVNGINKYAGEQYHQLYAKVHGLKTIALRLTNTYGPRQLLRHARQGFIGWFANRALTGSTIQLFGTGKQLRDFNYVDDVAEAMLLAAQTPACFGGAYNLSGERADLETIARQLIEFSGKGKFERVEFPAEAKKIDIGDFYGSSEKLMLACGWAPRVSLQDGLRRMVEYYQRNLKHYWDGQ